MNLNIDYEKFEEQEKRHKQEIQQFLEENNIEYDTSLGNFCLYYGNPDYKRSYEIEYVTSVKYPMAISSLGLQGVDKRYFFNLSRVAEENNSFKLWIKDFEWRDKRKREVLKSNILYIANKIQNRWYARDCEVREVPSYDGLLFEENNCFYGKRGASLRLGLYSKKNKNGYKAGTLLMLYSFGANFFAKKKNVIEVIRVGTLKNCCVVGGSSKLLKYFIKHYKNIRIGNNFIDVKHIKFYSDYDHHLGNSMESVGFKFHNYSNGGFMNLWLGEGEYGTIKHREPMRHKKVMEKIAEGKVISVPNAGVKTFIMDID